MGLQYVVAPGTILKEYIQARGLLQKDIAYQLDITPKHLSNIVTGKVKLTEEIALKLEQIFDDVKAEFWMDLEIHYRLHQLREKRKQR